MATVTVRLSDDLKAKANDYAEGLGIPLNSLMVVALDNYLFVRQQRMEEQKTESPSQPQTQSMNSLCECGSGKKYKRCCGAK
jgi:uncharacterized protein YecA (UPF0149 family)